MKVGMTILKEKAKPITITMTLMMILVKQTPEQAMVININVKNNNINDECKLEHANNEKSIIMTYVRANITQQA